MNDIGRKDGAPAALEYISREKINEVAEYLQGTAKSLGDALETFSLEMDEGALQQALLEADVEICGQCDWWHEVCELEYSEEHGCGHCQPCREELGLESEE
ncbi:hypothetical protein [Pseudomonas sp. PLMAX]|uniref:hypothetical protein n=1 Tax=Pseudomonas sp. PLMAX TaxID=2201998 RepID=UPI0038B97F10